MPKNLEGYVAKILEEAKDFLRNNFPEYYEEPDVKIKVKYRNKKLSFDYRAGYNEKTKEITIISYEKKKEPKDDDIITNEFKLRMKRKNTYLVSIIHEIAEAQYMNAVTSRNFPLTYYDITTSHEIAISLELHALKKLIEQSEGQDKEEFIKRKEAREKELKKREKIFKLRGV